MARRFDMEELLRLPSYYAPTVSRNKDQVAYYSDRSGRIELYVVDVGDGRIGEPKQLSDGQLPRSPGAGFQWTGADRGIVFPKDNDGDEQHNLYLLDTATGEVEQLTDVHAQHYPGPCSPDGKELLVMSNRHEQMNVFALDLETKEMRQLTRYANPAMASDWSADGRWIFFSTNETANLQNQDVYKVSRDGEKIERIYSSGEGNRDGVGPVSACGRWLGISTDATGLEQPVVLELATGATRQLGDGSGEEMPVEFSPDGERLLTLLSKHSSTTVVETLLETGERRELPLPAGVVFGARYLADGRILVNHTDPRHRPRLLACVSPWAEPAPNVAAGEIVSPDPVSPQTDHGAASELYLQVVLDAEYGRLSPDDFVGAEYVNFPSDDGLTIYGILYKPTVAEGERVPAIVFVHGGPTAQDYLMFNPAAQVFVNRGFAVLQVNYRGSTGYGREFREMNIHDIGGGDARDVAAGARFLQQDPDIDPSRILCAGGSYGGFMAYRQLTRFPALWAGGIAWVGITDWERLYDEDMAHFKYYLRMLFGGTPEEVPERYKEASPLHEAERLQAPLLIIHGVTDPRCPITQARVFKERIEELGKVEGEDFFYYELGEQGHGSMDMEERIETFRLMDDFLAKFV